MGAIAVLLFWVGCKLRWARLWTMALTLLLLLGYVAAIEQRTPVLRAALMAVIVVLGGFFFRRLELLNSAAIAALLLLLTKPSALSDSSFQLSLFGNWIYRGTGVAMAGRDGAAVCASGVRVLRTGRDGAVHIVTDGDRLEISCFVTCPKVSTVTTSKRAEAPNQNQNNQ